MVLEDHCCNEIKGEEMGKGFHLPIRSLSPSSALECHSSMAFIDATSTLGLLSFDLGSTDADVSNFYPLHRCAASCLEGMAVLYPDKQENSCNQMNEGKIMFGTSIVKQELEDKMDFVQPASFVYNGELVEALQASSRLGEETNKKSCDFSGSPVMRDSLERSTGEDCDVKTSPCSKGRKMVEKKVVCVPVGPMDGRQNDGPPSDMWAWQKYG
jgi:hypothetical protein